MFFGVITQRCCITRKLYNRLTKSGITLNKVRQNSSTTNLTHCVEELNGRGLLEVAGNEASAFLQGLITNDMKHLDEGSRSMYSMFLNSKGRVMYDAIIYKVPKKSVLLIECDKAALGDLHKHLKMFRVRRKVDINIVENFKVWSIFKPQYAEIFSGSNEVKGLEQEKIVPCQALNVPEGSVEFDNVLNSFKENEDTFLSLDPRQPVLGVRIIAKEGVDVEQLIKEKGIDVMKSEISYKLFRYKMGVGEGTEELPNGKCFPLEMNCDYLHGVSFHKGCYIGQELTARTHHTGVVRKRLMPIYLDKEVKSKEQLPLDIPIVVPGEKPHTIGKLRGISGNTAIGLLRIADALAAHSLKIGHFTGYTTKPNWWPHEAPKDNLVTKE